VSIAILALAILAQETIAILSTAILTLAILAQETIAILAHTQKLTEKRSGRDRVQRSRLSRLKKK
jgi:hypothetical protein